MWLGKELAMKKNTITIKAVFNALIMACGNPQAKDNFRPACT
jgi:hypothetical protein